MSSSTLQITTRNHSQSSLKLKSVCSTAPSHLLRSDKITDDHLTRLAIVYVRQSTQHQVLEHRESAARQYALADRAIVLGWPKTAVEIIDEDQARSGSSAEGRSGFQRLMAEVSSDRVGIILGLEMSRLARSCKDWHALLELCAIYRTLLADADGLYDPSDYNDRLLLGLKGTMSEAELHILKSRMQQGAVLESFVIERLLQAVAPASLELSLSAADDIEQERRRLDEHWQQRLTRSRFEIEQARRQYAAVDPDHRLVARELERRWDEALCADERLQAEYDRFSCETPKQLSGAERQQIQSLAEDLPALWHAASTTPKDRQAIARLLLEQVTVTVESDTDRVEVELRWAGGFVSRHSLTRPVQTYQQLSNYDELVGRIEKLRTESKTLSEIAATLNAEGFHPPKRSKRFTKGILSNLLRERRVKSGYRTDPELGQHLQANEWWLGDLASELSMPFATLHRWRRVGWVASRKVPIGQGRWAIYADTKEIKRMRQLRSATRTWPPIYPVELITPQTKTVETEPQNSINASVTKR